ncbi:MAG: SNF2-related protein [Desulfobulbia bacterium]
MSRKPTFRDYQRVGILHLVNRRHAGLFYDPGLGKTLTTLSAFEMLRIRKKLIKGRLLVVAPLSVAQTVWQDEIQEWSHIEHMTSCLLHGTKKKALLQQILGGDCPDVTVINYEGMKWLEEQLKGEAWPWDVLVFDELSKCKNASTQRAKIVSRIRRHFDRVWGLTGTPVPNSMLELFGQIKALDGGQALGFSAWKFREKHFYQKPYRQYEWHLKEGHEKIITDEVSHLVHRLDARKHLEMPDLVNVWHSITPSRKAMAKYVEMEKDFFTQLTEEEVASAVSAGVQWGKLQQITQGFAYIDNENDQAKQWNRFDTAKLDALQDIVEEAQGQPILVFYKFQADLAALLDRFNGKKAPLGVDLKKMDTAKAVHAWNAGEIPLLFANPQSAGHGLNMQKGGHIMVWYCLDSSNERYIQAKGRLYRQGQESTVVNHHLEVVGTVDSDIRAVLEGRATMQERVMERWESLQDDKPKKRPSPVACA